MIHHRAKSGTLFFVANMSEGAGRAESKYPLAALSQHYSLLFTHKNFHYVAEASRHTFIRHHHLYETVHLHKRHEYVSGQPNCHLKLYRTNKIMNSPKLN